MTIRQARDGDKEAFVALCRSVIHSNYATFLPAESVALWLAGDAVENYTASHLGTCHVAEQAGEVVACHVTDGDLLDLLMVHPARQGRGIGSAMLADAEVRLFKAHPVIRLESFAANTSTNRFYQRHGWRAAAPVPDPDSGVVWRQFDAAAAEKQHRDERAVQVETAAEPGIRATDLKETRQ